MSVTIDLQDEIVQRLQRQAEARQISLQEWMVRVLSRAPEFPDPAGRTPSQNAAIFLESGGWTYSGDPFAVVDQGPARVIHGAQGSGLRASRPNKRGKPP